MATKESKRQIRELVEGLEQRVHCGPAIRDGEIQSALDFLRQHDFSPASDYFGRLAHIENRLRERPRQTCRPPAKSNYGGKAGGCQMQVQSIFDHVILSTCYTGEFNTQRGKVKISHRFNQEGRVDFVELKFLYALQPYLNGELRKLLTVKNYPSLPKDWHEAEAFVLRILPQELVFLHEDIFHYPKTQLFAWLLNIGHGIVQDLLQDLNSREMDNSVPTGLAFNTAGNSPSLGWPSKTWNPKAPGFLSGNDRDHAGCAVMERNGNSSDAQSPRPGGYQDQLPLDALLQDEVARPILERAARLESVVEDAGDTEIVVRYARKSLI